MNKNKTTAIAIALILMLTITITLVAVPLTNAHDPIWTVPTYSFCSVSPNPIGVDQFVYVNFWVNIPPPTASAQYGDLWTKMNLIITKPDGTTDTRGPFTSDATGGTHTTYTPNIVGEYKFQMIFDGEYVLGANLPPPAFPGAPPNPNIGDYYQPSKSNIVTLTVQEEQITYPPVTPLPTNYWTRPIYGENNEWFPISGNWLGLAASTFATTGMYNATGNYNPYTTAPNTGHILWTKPEAFGGMIGGEYGNSQTANYYSTSQYEPKFAPIIMQGILYYTMFPGSSTYPAGWAAVDLHTGKTLWTKNTTELLRTGQIINMITPNQFGGLAYLWSVSLAGGGFFGSQTQYNMYDAMTGNYILSIVNATSMTLTSDDNGDLVGYYVNTTNAIPGNPFSPVTAASLTMWNSTRCINLNIPNYGGGPSVADQWMWRPPLGATLDFKLGIQWSAPLPMTDVSGNSLSVMTTMFGMTMYSYLLSMSAIQSNVVLLRGNTGFLYSPGWSEEAGFSAKDGHKLWGPFNRTEIPFSIVYTGGVWSGAGAYVALTESTLSVTGYSLIDGGKLWGPTALPNANPFSSLGANAISANGNIYIWLFGGDVYSYNSNTGVLNWEYHTPSIGYESPYGVPPLWTFTVGTIADGKLFVPEGHMYSPPLFHKAQQLALNLTTGEVVWSIDAFDVTSGPAISDGIMVTLNAYDNQIYAYGKGPTKATVTAPDSAYAIGTPIVIKGTVTDISSGTQQDAVAANFPNGLPCIADESMSDWMEYVYMQQPRPINATGVKVVLSVLDPNNNSYEVGTTTSNTDGTFGLMFDPEVPGMYTVIATFEGSESYYSSYATTYLYVTEAPLPAATPEPLTLPPTESYVVGTGIAIIIAVAIVGFLLLRRH
jgi:hypothetical protein